VVFGHDRPFYKAGWVADWTGSSDHGAFHNAGVPFVYLGVEDHADYHQPTDTAEKIDGRFLTEVANLAADLMSRLDAMPPRVQ
jgi:Zn-dependent M28 family amino/carboxypeptidase